MYLAVALFFITNLFSLYRLSECLILPIPVLIRAAAPFEHLHLLHSLTLTIAHTHYHFETTYVHSPSRLSLRSSR